MDYGKSFTFPFKDPDWLIKLIIGGVFTLLSGILVGIPFVLGYVIEEIRNVIAGRDEVLPAWDNLGEKFMQGLVLALVMIVLSLPGVLVGGCSSLVLSALGGNSSSQAVTTIVTILSILVYLVVALYGVVVGIALPAVYLRYTTTKQFGASLKPGAMWDIIKANAGQYILIVIISYAVSVVAGLGTILCVIGVFITMFYAYLVQAHLLGQYYRNFIAPTAPLVSSGAPAAL